MKERSCNKQVDRNANETTFTLHVNIVDLLCNFLIRRHLILFCCKKAYIPRNIFRSRVLQIFLLASHFDPPTCSKQVLTVGRETGQETWPLMF